MTTRKLKVYLHGRGTGGLTDNDGKLSYKYKSNAVTPLSVRLPLREKEYDDRECRPFFENLLPEGAVRTAVAKKEGVSESNVFSLLEKIGGDCAGAVSLYEEDQNSAGRAEMELKEIPEEELYGIIGSQRVSPLFTGSNIRLSLAGAQSKFAVYIKDEKMYYPNDIFFSTHLIKPGNADFKDIVINEYFCMKLAERQGITVPDVRIKKAKDMQYLIIDRFDRLIEDGVRERLHQEDLCQALGRTSDVKYQKEGGPGFKECYKFLEDRAGINSLERFVLILVFNYLTGNCDAHAKNFSILHDIERIYAVSGKLHAVKRTGAIFLSPFYDLVSTDAYDNLSREMAMKIGAAWDIREVQKPDFYKAAAEINIKGKEMDRIIREFGVMPVNAGEVTREVRKMGFKTDICEKISDGIERRLKKIS